MSRALARNRRIANDAYYTLDPLAEKLVDLLPIEKKDPVFEPSVGGGSFAKAVRDRVDFLGVMDLDPFAEGYIYGDRAHNGDFLEEPSPVKNFYKWIIGNPPFGEAEAHVRRALDITAQNVVFLLRLGFLESKQRIPFWRDFPCRRIWVLQERPSFTADGKTDSAAYGWFWWDLYYRGETTLSFISWR